MKDIFVSKEIAKQLKELGFDEPYIAFYYYKRLILTRNKATDIAESDDIIKAPTWEQVFKWFRDKGFSISMTEFLYTFSYKIGTLDFSKQAGRIEAESFPTYEECRDALILKLIELYQNN